VQGGASHAQVASLILAANLALIGLAGMAEDHPLVGLVGAVVIIGVLLMLLAGLGRAERP
jgi:hypothetical protein